MVVYKCNTCGGIYDDKGGYKHACPDGRLIEQDALVPLVAGDIDQGTLPLDPTKRTIFRPFKNRRNENVDDSDTSNVKKVTSEGLGRTAI